jgi:hypothetical protein
MVASSGYLGFGEHKSNQIEGYHVLFKCAKNILRYRRRTSSPGGGDAYDLTHVTFDSYPLCLLGQDA